MQENTNWVNNCQEWARLEMKLKYIQKSVDLGKQRETSLEVDEAVKFNPLYSFIYY